MQHQLDEGAIGPDASASLDVVITRMSDVLSALASETKSANEGIQRVHAELTDTKRELTKAVNASMQQLTDTKRELTEAVNATTQELLDTKRGLTEAVDATKQELTDAVNVSKEELERLVGSSTTKLKQEGILNLVKLKQEVVSCKNNLSEKVDGLKTDLVERVDVLRNDVTIDLNRRFTELDTVLDRDRQAMEDHVARQILLVEGRANRFVQQRFEQRDRPIGDTTPEGGIRAAFPHAGTLAETRSPLTDGESVQEIIHPSAPPMEDINIVAGCSPRFRLSECALPKFHGRKKDFPVQFLQELRTYYVIQDVPERYKLHVFSTAMLDNAKTWFKAFSPTFKNYLHCVEEFKRKFMNAEVQRVLKKDLEESTYVAKPGRTYVTHLLEMMVSNLDLLMPFSEEEFIKVVARHYPVMVQQVIIARRIDNLCALEDTLQSLDMAESLAQRRDPSTSRAITPRFSPTSKDLNEMVKKPAGFPKKNVGLLHLDKLDEDKHLN